jgi:small ligand-binding sensory domain FIST
VRPADANAIVWQQARLAGDTGCSVRVHGARIDVDVSRGWRQLCAPQTIELGQGYEVRQLGHTSALKSLIDVLPPALRLEPERHLHQLVALLGDADPVKGSLTPAAIISVNADGCVTLAERIGPGQPLAWAIRVPETAETDMRETVEKLAGEQKKHGVPPAGALMFSCIGRSPFFYGGEDRDLNAFTERFPGLPILGVYGTAQIAPLENGAGTRNGQFQNSVVTALMTPQAEEADV